MGNLQVKKLVTSYEYQIVNIPPHNEINECQCNECKSIAIDKAIKKDNWYTFENEFEIEYEAYV